MPTARKIVDSFVCEYNGQHIVRPGSSEINHQVNCVDSI